MDMTDLREKMMLYLEIQSPGQPGNDLISRSEVGGSSDLMNGPLGIYYLMPPVSHFEPGLFDDMRQLKNHRQGEAHGNMDSQETDEPGMPI